MRRRICQLEGLEARELLSALPEIRPAYEVITPTAGPGPTNSGYTPSQIQQAYGFNQVSNNGSGETIAIVDAYNDPNIQQDLATFDSAYNLAAPPSFTVVNQSGGSSLPSNNASWGGEESLDVEWAHAMAPGAKIILVEASSASTTNLLAAVKYASSVAQVVTMSWGGNEFSGENAYDSQYFSVPGVAFVAASGDSGAPAEWPAASPDVLGVGGTTLTLNSNGTYGSEVGWSGSSGGPSTYESQPSYQQRVVTQTSTQRATPDVAYDGDPNTGFAVYDSYGYSGWLEVGGTSAGAPQWAAIIAIADQGRSQPLSTSGSQSVQSLLYPNASTDFHDITSGNNGGYSAGPGYDYVTGLGSPIVNLVVASLDGATVTAPDTLAVSAPSTATAGSSFNFTVTAELPNNGGTDTGFTGTVTLYDGQTVLGSHTFAAGDHGTYAFSVTLDTAGTQTITAKYGSSSASAQVNVTPAPASQLVISGLSSSTTAGSPLTFTVTAEDPYGNVVTSYAGPVTITSTDSAAGLPASPTLSNGTNSFTVTFHTAGTQTVTVSGGGLSAATSAGTQVAPTAPTGLTATASTTSAQITLSWGGSSSGTTGYTIERSTSPTTGFTVIGTTSAGTTTYTDTGLTAGTTYYYYVFATAGSGGSIHSANSNTANATTPGTAPVSPTTDLLWSTSSVPSENVYVGPGSYDLGLKFESTSAGSITGVLFYKQTWMNGPNTGYLWSSNGTLLASATFGNETSYGWQQVNFSNSVAITANTIYIVSFSTSNAEAGATIGYFNGTYANGPLVAPSSPSVGGNGVYSLSSNGFPVYTEYSINFWVQPAFSPSSGSGASVKSSAVSGSGGGSASSAAAFVTTVPTSTPSGPMGLASSSRGTSIATATQPSVGFAPVSYRPAVTQGQTAVLWGSKPTSFLS